MVSNTAVVVTGTVGLVAVVLGCVMGWYGFPKIIENMVNDEIVLTPDSESFDPWQEPTSKVDVYMQFIMFNVTNADEVKDGGKPSVVEVGPFSYKEHRERVNLTWSDDGTTLTYYEVVTYVFDEETSGEGLSEDTEIVTINAPLMMLQQLIAEASVGFLLRPLVSSVLGPLLSQLFVRVPVRELLFEGSPVAALRQLLALPGSSAFLDVLCRRGLCGSQRDLTRIKSGRFPSLMYNNTMDGPYMIDTGKNDVSTFTHILSYKGNTSLSYWLTPYCNMLNGTDGITYPPRLDDRNRLYIFNKDLCRSIYLDYEKDVEYFGITARRYTPPKDVLEDPDIEPANRCFCVPDGNHCLKAGVMSLSPCQFGAPVVASTPHFYNGDPQYVYNVTGLSPDKNRHETFVDIEPLTGLPLNGGKKIQINLDLKRFSKVKGLENVPEILFPVMYTNETAKIDQSGADEFNSQVGRPLKLLTAAQWLLIVLGALAIVIAGALYMERSMTNRKKRQLIY